MRSLGARIAPILAGGLVAAAIAFPAGVNAHSAHTGVHIADPTTSAFQARVESNGRLSTATTQGPAVARYLRSHEKTYPPCNASMFITIALSI